MRKSVLIVVQNLPLPGDRRVWLECQALVQAGYEVCAITPKAKGDPTYQELQGVHLYKYDAYMAKDGTLNFFREFASCWLRTAALAVRCYRRHRFSVLQACNPPDTFWLLALLFRPLGVKFVFDQHDLCPEVYESRFHRSTGVMYRALRWLEKRTYDTAKHVIVTNESYKRVALGRGGCREPDVTVVRTGPDPDRLVAGQPDPALKAGRRFLACYIGVMGPQDGVDVVIRAADHIVNRLGRKDISFLLMGSGDSWEELVALRDSLGLSDVISMPGRVTDEYLFSALSSADVGLSPDPPGPLNDVSTMNKTMEYMAFGLPVLAFSLPETMVSADAAGRYVQGGSPEVYGEELVTLLDDEADRQVMGEFARKRIVDVLAWQHQRGAYVGVFDAITGAQRGAA